MDSALESALCLSSSSSTGSLSDLTNKVESKVFYFCFDFNLALFLCGFCLIIRLGSNEIFNGYYSSVSLLVINVINVEKPYSQ